jgi:hypothetical protein
MLSMLLKVLTNEKRGGGVGVVSFDRSGFKLFSLFLLFANNNCFPTSEENFLALFEFRRFFGSWGGGGTTLACGVLYRKLFLKFG